MVTDRAAVRELLCDHVPDVAGVIMARLEPFFDKAERGLYDLGRFVEISSSELASTLTETIGPTQACTNIEYVSFTELARQSGSLASAKERAAVWDKLAIAANPRFGQQIGRRFDAKLDAYLGSVLRLQIDDVLFKALIEPLWHSFEQNRWDAASDMFKLEVRATVIKAIEYYVGFGIAADHAPMRIFDRCLAVLPQTITLGRLEGTEGTFITLVD